MTSATTFDAQVAGNSESLGVRGRAGKAFEGLGTGKSSLGEAADQSGLAEKIGLDRTGSSGSGQAVSDLRSRWSAEMSEQTSQLAGQPSIVSQLLDVASEASVGAMNTLPVHNSISASTDTSTHRPIQLTAHLSPQPSIYRPSQLSQEVTGLEQTGYSFGLDAGGRAPTGTATVIEDQGGSESGSSNSQISAEPLRAPDHTTGVAAGALKSSNFEKKREPNRGAEASRTGIAANLVSAKPVTGKTATGKVSQDNSIRSIPRGTSDISSSASIHASTDGWKSWNGAHSHGDIAALAASVSLQTAPAESIHASSVHDSIRPTAGVLSILNVSMPARTPPVASSAAQSTANVRTRATEPRPIAGEVPAISNVLSETDLSPKTNRDLSHLGEAFSMPNVPASILSHRNIDAPGVSGQPALAESVRRGVESGVQGSPAAAQLAPSEAGKSEAPVAVSWRSNGLNMTANDGPSVVAHLPVAGRWGDDETLAGQAAVMNEAGIRLPEPGAQPSRLSGLREGSSFTFGSLAPLAGNRGENQSGTSQSAHAIRGIENTDSSAGMFAEPSTITGPVAGSIRGKITKTVSVLSSSPERAIAPKAEGLASAITGTASRTAPGAAFGVAYGGGVEARPAVPSVAQLVPVAGAPTLVSGQHGTALEPAGRSEAESIAAVSRSPFQEMDATDSIDAGHGTEVQTGVTAGRMNAGGVFAASPSLEMGYQDPAFGYVELHAHMSEGGVHASLSAQSPESGVALEAHLHSLADWMNDRQTPVESLTVLPFSGGRTGWNNNHAATTSTGGDSALFYTAGGNAGHRDGSDASHAAGGQNASGGEGKEHSGYIPAVETTTTLSGRVSDRTAGLPSMLGESVGSPTATWSMQTMDLNDGAARIGRTISVLA